MMMVTTLTTRTTLLMIIILISSSLSLTKQTIMPRVASCRYIDKLLNISQFFFRRYLIHASGVQKVTKAGCKQSALLSI